MRDKIGKSKKNFDGNVLFITHKWTKKSLVLIKTGFNRGFADLLEPKKTCFMDNKLWVGCMLIISRMPFEF